MLSMLSADVHHITHREGNSIWDSWPGQVPLSHSLGTAWLWSPVLAITKVSYSCTSCAVSYGYIGSFLRGRLGGNIGEFGGTRVFKLGYKVFGTFKGKKSSWYFSNPCFDHNLWLTSQTWGVGPTVSCLACIPYFLREIEHGSAGSYLSKTMQCLYLIYNM